MSRFISEQQRLPPCGFISGLRFSEQDVLVSVMLASPIRAPRSGDDDARAAQSRVPSQEPVGTFQKRENKRSTKAGATCHPMLGRSGGSSGVHQKKTQSQNMA